jgi:PRTRC genetic system protein E
MHIKTLADLLRKGDTLTLILSVEDENKLRLNVIPSLQAKDDAAALAQPLTITGTAEELDSPELIETLAKFKDKLTGLRSTLDEAEKKIKEAEDAAKAEAAKKIEAKKPNKKPAPAPAKPAEPENESDEDGDDVPEVSAQPEPAKPAAGAKPPIKLAPPKPATKPADAPAALALF